MHICSLEVGLCREATSLAQWRSTGQLASGSTVCLSLTACAQVQSPPDSHLLSHAMLGMEGPGRTWVAAAECLEHVHGCTA